MPTSIVIGSGLAGHRLVDALASLPKSSSRCVLLGEEGVGGYDRRFLPQAIDGVAVPAYAESWYQERGVDAHLDDAAIAIDRAKREVVTASGIRYGYDRVVLATGALPWLPDIPGRDLPGVLTLRSADDAALARAAFRRLKRVVVIGGGPIGVDTAFRLARAGGSVSLVEVASSWCLRHIDRPTADRLDAHLEAAGIQRYPGRQALGIQRTGQGLSVSLSGGVTVEAELIILVCGIRPRDELAAASGLRRSFDGGIRVDEHLCTEDPRIYAFGECARFGGSLIGGAEAIIRAVPVLIAGLTGEDARFDEPGADVALDLAGVGCWSIGEVHGSEIDQALRWSVGGDHRTVVLRGTHLVGACGFGHWNEVASVAAAVSRRLRLWPWQVERFRRHGSLWGESSESRPPGTEGFRRSGTNRPALA